MGESKRLRQQLEQTLGDGPLEEAYREEMVAIAQALDETFNGDASARRKTGFVLLVFPFDGHQGRCNFTPLACPLQRREVKP